MHLFGTLFAPTLGLLALQILVPADDEEPPILFTRNNEGDPLSFPEIPLDQLILQIDLVNLFRRLPPGKKSPNKQSIANQVREYHDGNASHVRTSSPESFKTIESAFGYQNRCGG